MKLNRLAVAGLLVLTVAWVFMVIGCTSESTRAVLTVVSLNGGNAYYSDLINETDSLNTYIPVDDIKVKLGNVPHDGSAPLAPGAPFSEIVVTGYSVTYSNGVFSPVSGGMNLRIPSGGTAEGTIAISNPSEKAALLTSLTGAVTSTANITFTGYVRTSNAFGDYVTGTGGLTVQVANFGDTNVNQ